MTMLQEQWRHCRGEPVGLKVVPRIFAWLSRACMGLNTTCELMVERCVVVKGT